MNVKPTDLAYVVKAPFGGPVGIVVEVLGPYGDYEGIGFIWYCKSNQRIPTIDMGEQFEVLIADDWLRPISGIPLNDEVTDDLDVMA